MEAKRKRILITGASGFIGGFLVKEALQRGYEVWAGVRAGSSLKNLQDERIHFIDLQYEDKDVITKQLRDVVSTFGAWHYVIHNAGITKTNNTANFYKVNARYTSMLLEALANADCIPVKFLLMSSLSSYGAGDDISYKPIRTDDEQKPESCYGKSKLQAEHFVRELSCFPYLILCPTGVYGPGEKDYMKVAKSIKSGFDFKIGMKPQRITFIYVKDLAVATFLAIENPAVINTTFFVTDGNVYTDNEYAEIVKKLLNKRLVLSVRIPLWLCYIACVVSEWTGKITGKASTLNKDKYLLLKQRNWTCDTDKTQQAPDFIPQYNLFSGLQETLQF